MEKSQLNKKDLKLIEILCQDSRRNTGDIAKKLNVSKQAVHKKLEKINKAVILKYVTILDYYKLGYNNLHLYLKIQGVNRKIFLKKIDRLKNINNITWITTLMGDYDLALSIFFESISELYIMLNRVYSVFKDSIKHKELHLINRQFVSHLVFDSPKKIVEIGNKNKVKISEIDKKILNYIESNSRFEWNKITSKLKLNYQTIKRHVADLESQKIILGYGAIIDYNLLKYSWNLCILDISLGTSPVTILEKIKKEKNIPFISTTVENKIIFDFISRNYEELKDFLDKLKEEFPKDINDYKILSVISLNKLKESYS